MYLDGIEHGIIRKDFNEPRIHFAVVCASIGCPQLRGEAFVSAKLEKQLEEQAVSFLSDSSRNRYNSIENKLELSKIFDWYGDDFKKKFGSVQAFISPRISKDVSVQKKIMEATTSFLEYNWNLNEVK